MTHNTPSEPGFYWATWNYDEQRHVVRLVKHFGENAHWYVEVPGWGNRFQVDYFRDWSGPIREQDAECSEVVCAACHWSGETSQLCLESIPCPDCGKNGLRVTR